MGGFAYENLWRLGWILVDDEPIPTFEGKRGS